MAKIKFRTPVQVFRKWVEELRSGNYKQISGQLREADYNEFDKDEHGRPKVVAVKGFCCLGVLCDIAAKDGGEQWNDVAYNSLNDSDSELPKKIRDYLGLDDTMVQHLIDMNDVHWSSFSEIADEIEFNIMPACSHA
jgi:hypothetical protein